MRAPAAVKEERMDTTPAAPQQLLKKGPWTAAEDAILMEYVRKHAEGNWNSVQKNSGLQRCGKSCRLRWANHLRPDLKKGSFSFEEEMIILQLHAEFGNKWARMAAHLPGRTDNEIKNYWNTRIKRRQRAGLPTYPPEIQQQMALRSHRQGKTGPWITASPLSIKPLSETPFSLFNSSLPPISQYPFGSLLEEPNRGKNIPLAFPNFTSPVQYGLGNFDLGPPPQQLQLQPSYSVKMELPSSQFFSNSGSDQMLLGNSGLLDALLPDSHVAGGLLSTKCFAMDPLGKLCDLNCTLGIQVKQEVVETVNQDLSTLLDMIPVPTTPTPMNVFSDWYNNSTSDGGEFSNGPSSVVTTDDDTGLEMQQLASTLSMAPMEHDWGLGACSWDNMPNIC